MDFSTLNLTSRFNSPPTSSSTPIFANREGNGSVSQPIFTDREGGHSVSSPIFTDREGSNSTETPVFTQRDGSASAPTPVFTLEDRTAVHSEVTDDFLITDANNSEASKEVQTVSDDGPGREITVPTSVSKTDVSKSEAQHMFDTLLDRMASSHGEDSTWLYAKMQESLGLSDL